MMGLLDLTNGLPVLKWKPVGPAPCAFRSWTVGFLT